MELDIVNCQQDTKYGNIGSFSKILIHFRIVYKLLYNKIKVQNINIGRITIHANDQLHVGGVLCRSVWMEECGRCT